MENFDNGETTPILLEPSEPVQDGVKVLKARRWPWILLGILILLVGTAFGAWFGYQSGIQMRLTRHANDVAIAATTQFQLGLGDQAAGRYEMAQKRFEYVIQLDPNFPGVSQKLAEVMLANAIANAPTEIPSPTPIITPTPDNRGVEELISQAQDNLRKKDWTTVINTLDVLRKTDITYRAVDADGMYYMALRFRGIDKILKEGNLEGGLYDLALAERFGPLDGDADGYRTWARLYLAGASFWGVDWPKVIDYFSQIILALPNLRDGTMTAIERYHVALMKYGDQLALKEQFCDAQKQYEEAQTIGSSPAIEATLTYLKNQCTPPVTKTPKPTKVKVQVVDTETSVPPAADTSTPVPTETPVPPAADTFTPVPTETPIPTKAS
jgi:tetratricopeptide (TPR) repeat protein